MTGDSSTATAVIKAAAFDRLMVDLDDVEHWHALTAAVKRARAVSPAASAAAIWLTRDWLDGVANDRAISSAWSSVAAIMRSDWASMMVSLCRLAMSSAWSWMSNEAFWRRNPGRAYEGGHIRITKR